MSLIYFFLIAAVLVLVHEWGHFAAARATNVGVQVFSLGFGRALAGFTDAKTGTRWQLAWIPLGGYVQLAHEAQDSQSNLVRDQTCKGKPFEAAPYGVKVLILSAGVAANLLLALGLYAGIAYFSAPPPAPVLAAPPSLSPAALAGLQVGDTITALNGVQIASWDALVLEIGKAQSDNIDPKRAAAWRLTVQAPSTQGNMAANTSDNTSDKTPDKTPDKTLVYREVSLKAPSEVSKTSNGSPTYSPNALGLALAWQGLRVETVMPNSLAQTLGLRSGDQILSLQNQTLDSQAALKTAVQTILRLCVSQITSAKTLAQDQYQAQNQDQSLVARVLRATEPITLRRATPKNMTDAQCQSFGLRFEPVYPARAATYGLTEVLHLAGAQLSTQSLAVLRALGHIIPSAFKEQNKAQNAQSLGGPVAIAQAGNESAQQGLRAFLTLLAQLSICMAVFNLLPLAQLDGGQLLYHSISAASGLFGARTGGVARGTRALNYKVKLVQFWNIVSLLLLAYVFVLVLSSDVRRMFQF